MKIVNRTRIELDVRGFQIDQHHVHVQRSENYHVGKRIGSELELGCFSPKELRDLHKLCESLERVLAVQRELPPELLEKAEVIEMRKRVENMRAHVAQLPSLELLEQFEAESEDGWYLYPR